MSAEQRNNVEFPTSAARGGVEIFRIRSNDNKISKDTFRKTILSVVMIRYGNKFVFTDGVPTIITSKNPRQTSVLANTLYKKSVGVQTTHCCYVQYDARVK